MSSHLRVADAGYHHLLVEEEIDNFRESFFNTVVDYPLSHANCQFRFSLPGQHTSDDYQRHIRGFFQNEPCIYNHTVFGHAATLFDVMKHPPEAFQSGAAKSSTVVKKVVTVAVQQQQVLRPKFNRKQSIAGSNLTSSAVMSTASMKNKSSLPAFVPWRTQSEIDLPDIEFTSQNEKRLTYQLVFQTLKCT